MSAKSFTKLVKVMEKLRSRGGCPWDRAQTHSSLKKHLIEEAYEVCEAIDSKDPERLKDELGDFLFQVVFHAQVAKERGAFDIKDVIRASYKKMLRRHPHVFGKHKAKSPEDAYKRWQEKKGQEKNYRSRKSLLDGVPKTLPALLKAQKISKRAASAGFDWPDVEFAVNKVHEELEEVKEELKSKNKRRLAEEIGDLLFVITIVARFGGVDAEDALHSATKKFARRFGKIESTLKRRNKKINECGFEELYRLWRINR
ncbi:MAG: nucleoside triphosphate pyrophosphohydrolase [Candidatus Omnitrophota bacterium]|nr:nucleoside triphosphate pyrophosphohydrolase [Candidatus Omnitrophota bacterium]